MTVAAVNSALQQARATLAARDVAGAPIEPLSEAHATLLFDLPPHLPPR